MTYKNLLACIRKNLGEYILKIPYSKWLILFREFLLNIEQESELDPMTNDRFKFVGEHYEAICALKKMADDYIKEIQKKGLDAIRMATNVDESDVFTRQENWQEHGIALRLYSKQWGGKSNIVLLVDPNGSFCVQFYVYDISECDVSKLSAVVNDGKYTEDWEQSTIRYFGKFDNSNLDTILQEIHEVARRLDSYYGK